MTSFRLALFVVLNSFGLFAQAPSVNEGGVLNVASYAFKGLPNSGIAQGSIFAIFGTNMGPTLGVSATSFPLKTLIAGTSLAITVAGQTIAIPAFYVSATQINAMLPSSTPTGVGSLVVSYNGVPSQAAPVLVVAHSPGIFSLHQTGGGPGVMTDANYKLFSLTHAAHAGDALIIWGTGLGAVAGDDLLAAPTGAPLTNVPVTVNIGGLPATLLYRGRSPCCAGLDQIIVTVPAGLSGCHVPVYVKAGGVISNFVDLPIAGSGDVCMETNAFSSSLISSAAKKGSIRYALLGLNRISFTYNPTLLPGGVPGTPIAIQSIDTAEAWFQKSAFPMFSPDQSPLWISNLGACSVSNYRLNSPNLSGHDYAGDLVSFVNSTVGTTALDAGSTLSLAAGATFVAGQTPPLVTLDKSVDVAGAYSGSPFDQQTGDLIAFLPPGAYTYFSSGGADVPAFHETVTMPSPVTWTNKSTFDYIDHTKDLLLTWTGGAPGTSVSIVLAAVAYPSNGLLLEVTAVICGAESTSGKFTIPAEVMGALPVLPRVIDPNNATSVGYLILGSTQLPQTFTLPGVDTAISIAATMEGLGVGIQ